MPSEIEGLITMDLDLVRSILQNSGEDISKFTLNMCSTETEENKFGSTNSELNSALSKSLATLLCYRVSPAVHQRYSVRTNLIEQLRDWSRITRRYSHLQSFTDGEKTTKFTINLVNKYLTEEFLEKQFSVDVLVKLSFALIDIKIKNPTLEYKLDSIINRILCLHRTPISDSFLNTLIDYFEHLSLSLTTIENLYISQAEKLIEIPIVDSLILFNMHHENGGPNLNSIKNQIEFSANDCPSSISRLLKYSSKSPYIFQLLSSILKEILSHTTCFETFVNFIQFLIKYINKLCEEDKNTILDLYPRHLQCAVILLRIEPKLHTSNSKDYIIQKLKSIYSSNQHELLIMLTHFPLWLEEFTSFISVNNDLLLR